MIPGSLLLLIHAPPNSSRHYLLLVLKTILIHYKQYCDGLYNHSGINCFWIINNSTEVLDRLHLKLIRPQELENLIVTILLHYIRISHTMP